MPATTGGDADAKAPALRPRIGAEFDRRLDARLTPPETAAKSPSRARAVLPPSRRPGARTWPRHCQKQLATHVIPECFSAAPNPALPAHTPTSHLHAARPQGTRKNQQKPALPCISLRTAEVQRRQNNCK